MKKIFISILALSLLVTFIQDAEAARKKKRRSIGAQQSKSKYPSKAPNPNFLNSCSQSLPTVYNPSKNSRMEGGANNRMGEKVISVEEAAKTGKPVTVAMDRFGDFGSKCNWKSSDGSSTRRCLLLVHVPGLDQNYPAYGKKFPNLPVDSLLAIVEDTGGAFSYKGTGKIDIPFSKNNFHKANPFKAANFEVLQSGMTNGKEVRRKDFSHFSPFVGGRSEKCSWDASRRTKNAPNHSSIATNVVQ